jgi:hypothetical protein
MRGTTAAKSIPNQLKDKAKSEGSTRLRLNIARASAVDVKPRVGGDNRMPPKFPWVRRG